ncbi:FGGY family carbohydrate kinase [Geofilum rubicundum]|uniref:L-fuculokinase n=1 Tax=Geofilum rubicundum JCM 15548 TaxID=1236989 RepID=A0A0E9LZP8_9BACT|nr:FGGY family carbohydrate kinase [Geofilum rubicundum]GAO30724.1 L-fuculokinase [Geofilum rubicundum JCM 15548]
MNKKDNIAIVFDCGATNIRVIAMDAHGQIRASKSLPNATEEDPNHTGGRIWNVENLWQKFTEASKQVVAQINDEDIVGVTVTTFGVDGTFVDEAGKQLYPVISWQCPRLESIMTNIHRYMAVEELYRISGVFPYAFNTIAKMVWFKENHPEVIEKASQFLFMPSLFLKQLGAEPTNDSTMLGTSMMADLKNRGISEDILKAFDLPKALFGNIGEPGDCVGSVSATGAEATGIPEGVPLFLTGHDTQFAIFGSGADLNQPVLSSGTWEILMARSAHFSSSSEELKAGLTTEADARPGRYTIGQNWLGSGVLEWFSRHFYPGLKGDELYQTMIEEAEAVLPHQHGLIIDPGFLTDGGQSGGVIKGLTLQTSRAEIYRALLEGWHSDCGKVWKYSKAPVDLIPTGSSA